MKTQIKTSFTHLFVNGDASAKDLLTLFCLFGIPAILFFVGEEIINHIK